VIPQVYRALLLLGICQLQSDMRSGRDEALPGGQHVIV
jgi:hypothetical protein